MSRWIYNSRNLILNANGIQLQPKVNIYNSRNLILNANPPEIKLKQRSTTVEI